MRSRFFGKKPKNLIFYLISAVLILASVFNIFDFSIPVSAVAINDARTACESNGGTFTDNTGSASSNAGECSGRITTHDESTAAQTMCSNSGGIYTTLSGGSEFRCTWSTFDDAAVSPMASELQTICENDGETFVPNTGTDGVMDCHGLPMLRCQSSGGNYIGNSTTGICRWTNVTNDLSNTPATTTPSGTEATCHSSSGALGWILCPVLEFAASAAKWAYESVVMPNLETNPQLFQIDGDRNGTYQAWQVFRDFANIIFVIFLLFVIFSQVTGIGIDNYGIKKTLPNLIIAAVLVNLSFFICQGCVDLSNIAGHGLYDLIGGISNNITLPAGTEGVMGTGGSIAVGVLEVVAVGAVGTIIGGVAFWSMIGTAILALVPAILGAVVGILMLWALLSVRQAVVVVLVALSPLAIICYSLPNAKPIFNRWRSILQGMLLLFPISAVLMAGGRLASRIIYASGGTANNLPLILTAILAEAAPIFFIPSLTRSAYQATGALGATLNNLRNRAARGTRNRVGNWSMVNSARQRQNENILRRRAGVDRNGNARNLNAFQRAIRGGRQGVARSRVAYDKILEQQERVNRASSQQYLQNQRELREDRAHRDNVASIVSETRRNGGYGGRNYGHGADNNAMMRRYIELANRFDAAGTTQDERDECEALFRMLGDAGNKAGVTSLNGITYDRTAGGLVTGANALSDNGLLVTGRLRLRNADTAATLSKKDGIAARHFSDIASNPANARRTRAQILSAYAASAVNDTQDINDQSGATIAMAADYMSQTQRSDYVNNNDFSQLITDAGKRDSIITAYENNHITNAGAAPRVPLAAGSGYSAGNYHIAPQGWVIDNAASAAAAAPVYRSATNATHSRRYNAQTNTFF